VKIIVALLVLGLVGCASTRPKPTSSAISYEELNSIQYTMRDCKFIDQRIEYIEKQLRNRGVLNSAPESLSEPDRMYNATGRILIWNLRVGCNNPNRFSKQ
jgi:hypothetical protein